MYTFRRRYLPFVAGALLALLFGLWAGLLRIGWVVPTFDDLAAVHGPLMVAGFLGMLIPLERAVAIRQRWMFGVPLLTGLGWLALFVTPPLGVALFALSGVGTLAILSVMVKREPQSHTLIMWGGALALAVGNLFWLVGRPLFQVVLWWMAFLILTIGGERLELSRVLRPTVAQVRLLMSLALLLLLGVALTVLDMAVGARVAGLAMLGMGAWFLRYDLARYNLRHRAPLTRYIATCLFGGFIWLAVTGLFLLAFGAVYAGLRYDAVLHSLFVGFVIAMIFGHAPIIFPAILGVPVTFSRRFYVHLILLHLSLLMRVSGDLLNHTGLRQWGGLLNVVAILLFLAMTVTSLLTGRRSVTATAR